MVVTKTAPNPFPHSVHVSFFPQPTRKCACESVKVHVSKVNVIHHNQCEFSGSGDAVTTY